MHYPLILALLTIFLILVLNFIDIIKVIFFDFSKVEENMKKPIYPFLLLIIGMALVSCGGGGGGGGSSSTSTSTGSSTTYTASGSVGEVLNFTINTAVSPPTYNYTIIKSAYGLANTTGSGTLSSNSDGSYTPSCSPNSRVLALSN